MSVLTDEQALAELVQRHREIYNGPAIDGKLEASFATCTPSSPVGISCQSCGPLGRLLTTPMWVVSGHHTATYLRFGSVPVFRLSRLLAQDMGGQTDISIR
jgi:orotate phosphoribosyltransferase